MKPGKRAEMEVAQSLAYLEGQKDGALWWMRIFDASAWIKVNKNLWAPDVPADFIVIYNGVVHFIEVKSSKNARYYYKRYVREHQITDGKEIIAAGGRYWFLFINRATPRRFEAWALTPHQVEEIFSRYPERKSVKWLEIAVAGREVRRLPGSLWDLESIFEG